MRKHSFFTLIELLIVIVVIGILATLMLPMISNLGEDAEDAVGVYNARALASQLEIFKAANGAYPAKFYTGFEEGGMGTGLVTDSGYILAEAHQKAAKQVKVSSKLSENVRMNLSRGVQVAKNGPVTKSLAMIGISRLVFGDPTQATLYQINGATTPIWDPNVLTDSEILMWEEGTTFNPAGEAGVICVNSWKDANGDEIVLSGRTLAQYIKQPMYELNGVKICHIAALVIGPQVDWAGYYDTQGRYAGASRVKASSSSPKTPHKYAVAFFATSSAPNLVKTSEGARPAYFLGCVDADGNVVGK